MTTKSLLSPEYLSFLNDLKTRIQAARLSAARAVNRDLILLYWDIGRAILEKQTQHGWGDSVVETLARDLRSAFPGMSGFSVSSLWRMRQFYVTHSSKEFLAQAVRELGDRKRRSGDLAFLAQAVRDLVTSIPWGHHVELLNKIKDEGARLYYLRAAARFGWSRNVLLNQIRPMPTSVPWPRARLTIFPRRCPNTSPNRPRRYSRVPTTWSFSEFTAR